MLININYDIKHTYQLLRSSSTSTVWRSRPGAHLVPEEKCVLLLWLPNDHTFDDHLPVLTSGKGVPRPTCVMALVPGINVGVGLLVLIILWALTILAIIALAAVPKARFATACRHAQVCDNKWGVTPLFLFYRPSLNIKICNPCGSSSICGYHNHITVLSTAVAW